MKRLLPALAAALLLAPAAAARAGGATPPSPPLPTLEIVTFRLLPGTEIAVFLEAARGTEAFLRARGGLTGRWLTPDETGLWTDLVAWSSRDDALAAADVAMAEPSFGAFTAAIDPESVGMRHALILWQME